MRLAPLSGMAVPRRAALLIVAAILAVPLPRAASGTDGPLNPSGCHWGGRPARYHCHSGADASHTFPNASAQREIERQRDPARALRQTETGYLARVVRAPDGETIHVKIDNRVEKVRYIGISTPEATHPEWRDADMWQAARRVNQQLVLGKIVVLEFDAQRRDGLGRLLAYVWVDDLMVNAELVRLGYATAVEMTNVRHQDLIQRLAREAKETRRGLWGRDDAETAVAKHRQQLAPPDATAGVPRSSARGKTAATPIERPD